ncbi:hypothetical protein HPB48_005808 [Haemaphysalis longicornis]|uniref:Uncharacterized protein n=1 Tax=Haemaphysalis longicornis TaxID=44386 RepID=A0A9J6GLV3_HAELO|nr:hypothetical protein HPB48_005808 [Haemaphysalis longicornis]
MLVLVGDFKLPCQRLVEGNLICTSFGAITYVPHVKQFEHTQRVVVSVFEADVSGHNGDSLHGSPLRGEGERQSQGIANSESPVHNELQFPAPFGTPPGWVTQRGQKACIDEDTLLDTLNGAVA